MGGNTMIAELIANGIVTLTAAFFGAWAAFKLESSDRKKQIEDDHVAAGNRALFKLTQIWSKLRQYQKEIVDDYRERPDAWLNLPVGTSIQDSSLVFGMDELEFIMNTKPTVFQQIFLESDRFRMVAKLIDERSELMLSEVHPRMSNAGIPVGGSEREDVMEGLISIGIVHQLKIITAGIIRNVDADEISSFEVYTALRAVLKEVYPNRKFLEFQKAL